MVNERASFERIKTIVGAYTLTVNDNTIIADGATAAVPLTVPAASVGSYKFTIEIKDITNPVTLVATGGDVVPVLDQIEGKTYTIQSDGVSAWIIVGGDVVFGDTEGTAVEGNDPRIGLVSGVSYKNTIVTDINQTTRTNLSWDLVTEINTNPTKFTAGINGITVIEDGDYKICSSIFLIGGTNNERKSVNLRIEINGVITTVQSQGYIRMAQGANECSAYIEEVINLTAGDVINISGLRAAGTGIAQCPAGSSVLSVFKLK